MGDPVAGNGAAVFWRLKKLDGVEPISSILHDPAVRKCGIEVCGCAGLNRTGPAGDQSFGIRRRYASVTGLDPLVAYLHIPEREYRQISAGQPVTIDIDALADQRIIAEYTNGLGMMKSAIRNEDPDFDFSPFDRELKSLIMGDYKYIWDSTGKEELYFLGTDPDEEIDIATRERSMILQFRQILAESTDAGENRSLFENVPPIDEATRDALKALGYEP